MEHSRRGVKNPNVALYNEFHICDTTEAISGSKWYAGIQIFIVLVKGLYFKFDF